MRPFQARVTVEHHAPQAGHDLILVGEVLLDEHRVDAGRVVRGLPGRGPRLPRQPAHPVARRRDPVGRRGQVRGGLPGEPRPASGQASNGAHRTARTAAESPTMADTTCSPLRCRNRSMKPGPRPAGWSPRCARYRSFSRCLTATSSSATQTPSRKSWRRREPPVRPPDGALVAPQERVPGDDGERQLVPDHPQVALGGAQQRLAQRVRQHRRTASSPSWTWMSASPQWSMAVRAGPVEDVEGLIQDDPRGGGVEDRCSPGSRSSQVTCTAGTCRGRTADTAHGSSRAAAARSAARAPGPRAGRART